MDDCRCQEPTSQRPRIIVVTPRVACAKITRETTSDNWGIPMLSKEGNIMTRKDAIFRTTAISMVKPCRKFLCFC